MLRKKPTEPEQQKSFENQETGTLFLVPTPIGNLQDISFRALEVLKTVDVVASEDTRHSLILFRNFGITTPLVSYHDFIEKKQSDKLLGRLISGQSVALISDAGTPLISDPGFRLVNQARSLNIQVTAVPGATALISALSISGLSTDQFYFGGFLPHKAQQRRKRLQELKKQTCTWIVYESPHRIMSCLEDCLEVLGPEHSIVLAKELTKMFEKVLCGTVASIYKELEEEDRNNRRGELVLLVEGTQKQKEIASEITELIHMLLEDCTVKRTVEIVVTCFEVNKREVYEKALMIKGNRLNNID